MTTQVSVKYRSEIISPPVCIFYYIKLIKCGSFDEYNVKKYDNQCAGA
jgi:hypothetical protein